jgi:hypothetical protein
MYKCISIVILRNLNLLIGFKDKALYITLSKVEFSIASNQLSPTGKTNGTEGCVF